jgi:acylphosphatase
MPPRVERRTYTFGGDVQGVGFRYTAQHLARSHPVSGYVRNLPDGRVEMVAEGEAKEIEALVEALQRQMEGHIRRTDFSTAPAKGDFSGFTIRH